jgi:hypothetical protein
MYQDIPLPTVEDRAQLLKINLREVNVDPDVGLPHLAELCEGYPPYSPPFFVSSTGVFHFFLILEIWGLEEPRCVIFRKPNFFILSKNQLSCDKPSSFCPLVFIFFIFMYYYFLCTIICFV